MEIAGTAATAGHLDDARRKEGKHVMKLSEMSKVLVRNIFHEFVVKKSHVVKMLTVSKRAV